MDWAVRRRDCASFLAEMGWHIPVGIIWPAELVFAATPPRMAYAFSRSLQRGRNKLFGEGIPAIFKTPISTCGRSYGTRILRIYEAAEQAAASLAVEPAR